MDKSRYYRDWYDIIGFVVSFGGELSSITEAKGYTPQMVEIAKYLDERYTTKAWYNPR